MPALPGTTAVEGGLPDPVQDAQVIFRGVMNAFARPGTIADLGRPLGAPAPLIPAAAAFLAALADLETPIWLEDCSEAAASWLTFQTGAPFAKEPEAARFAVCSAEAELSRWQRFPVGTAAYPDRSATLLLPVRSWSGGHPLTLIGPGIETSRLIAPAGLPEGFLGAMAANAALFPCGLDLLLVCGMEIMALPRTTRVREA
jgi:alpha-D-ribose 1-methylphosphonate 5-triphosphate synthase subunit PhnH